MFSLFVCHAVEYNSFESIPIYKANTMWPSENTICMANTPNFCIWGRKLGVLFHDCMKFVENVSERDDEAEVREVILIWLGNMGRHGIQLFITCIFCLTDGLDGGVGV